MTFAPMPATPNGLQILFKLNRSDLIRPQRNGRCGSRARRCDYVGISNSWELDCGGLKTTGAVRGRCLRWVMSPMSRLPFASVGLRDSLATCADMRDDDRVKYLHRAGGHVSACPLLRPFPYVEAGLTLCGQCSAAGVGPVRNRFYALALWNELWVVIMGQPRGGEKSSPRAHVVWVCATPSQREISPDPRHC